MDFQQLLLEALIEWRKLRTKERKSVSLNAFADYLGISRPSISRWFNEHRTPDMDSLIIIAPNLAKLLGDQIYTNLNLSRPDNRLEQLYDQVPPENKDEFLEEVRKLLISHSWVKLK